MKKLKFKYEGKTVNLEESSHAALFRKFFEWWKNKDMEQAIYGTFESGLRLSDEEFFEGAVIKKKNLQVADDLYVITHITPAAMDKGIYGFLDAVEAEVIEPKRKEKAKATPPPEPEPVEEDEPEDYEQIESAIKSLAQKLSAPEEDKGKNKKSAGNISMSDLVKKKMKLRDQEIKARLMKGNKANES